ncbi:MAG: hypothetical protein ABJZ54_00615 [Luteolibacter sp.]
MVLAQVCGVTYLTKLLLTLCVFAGILVAMGHKDSHSDNDECAVQHGSVSSDQHKSSDDSHHDDGQTHDSGSTHHHECCHLQNMDQGAPFAFSSVSYVTHRLEVSLYHSLMPDSPVFSLDKPPLI